MQAMVVTGDVSLRDGLEMVVAAIAGCDAVDAIDCERAGQLAAEHPLQLVLVDGRLPDDEIQRLLQELECSAPSAVCVVLAEWEMQREALSEAGADLVVVKGEPAPGLFRKLERLLAGQQGAPAPAGA